MRAGEADVRRREKLARRTTITGMDRTYRSPNHAPCRLAPLEAFSDELAENGLEPRGCSHTINRSAGANQRQ